jgi:hypothetical protein
MTTKGRGVSVAALAVLLATLGVGCSSGSAKDATPKPTDTAPKVWTPGGTGADLTTIPAVGGRVAYSFGSLMICAEKLSSPVTITSVSLPIGSHGLRVVDFGTRPNPFLRTPPGQSFGAVTGTAASHKITGRTVGRCLPPRAGSEGNETASTELIIALERSGPETGSTKNVVVHYISAGRSGTSSFPEGMTLCSPADGQGACGR